MPASAALLVLVLVFMRPAPALAILNDGSRCKWRVQQELDALRRAASSSSPAAVPAAPPAPARALDLAGYLLYQPLRSAPYDMYVTNIRIRVPSGPSGWVSVERCLFEPRNRTLDAHLLFRDLAVTGRVRLLSAQSAPLSGHTCSMTLRLRRAGLGLTASPGQQRGSTSAGVEVRSLAHFVEPVFVRGCSLSYPSHIQHRSDQEGGGGWGSQDHEEDLSGEIEDAFLRGVRTLLASYMERRLRDALRDALMAALGYALSYGR